MTKTPDNLKAWNDSRGFAVRTGTLQSFQKAVSDLTGAHDPTEVAYFGSMEDRSGRVAYFITPEYTMGRLQLVGSEWVVEGRS